MKKSYNEDLFKRERIEIFYSSDDGLFKFVLGRVNHLKASEPISTHIHNNTLEVTYLVRGRQNYIIDNKEYEFSSGDILIVFPDEIHGSGQYFEDKSLLYFFLINIEENSDSFMGFMNEDSEKLLQALKNIRLRRFRGNPKFQEIFDNIIEVYFSENPLKNVLIRCYITEFIVGLVECEKATESNKQENMQLILKYIQQNIFDEIRIDDLANYAHLSVSYFVKLFKNQIGISPHEYVLREKIEASKNMLMTSKQNVIEIAYALGFSSSQYFSTVFKRFTGISPSEYRNKYKYY